MNVGGIHLQHTTHLYFTCLVGGFKFQPIWKICASQIGSFHFSKWGMKKENIRKTPPSCTFTGSWREKNLVHNISIHLHSDMSNLLMTSLLPCKLLRFSCFFDRLKYLNGGGALQCVRRQILFYTEFSMCNPIMLRNLWNIYLHV